MPSLWFTLFCAALACMCLGLALWQHQRAELKAALQSQVHAAAQLAAVDVAAVPADAVAGLAWRKATAQGAYAAPQFLVDNRFFGNEVGLHVIAPLQLDSGRWLLVNRGWLKAPPQRSQISAPAAPPGRVTVAGTLAPDAAGAFELGDEPDAATGIFQHLKIDRWQRASGREALPLVLLDASGGGGLAAVRAAPDFKAERSYGYRLQWLALALVAAGGWLAVALRGERA